jgi:hypothetical protein
MGQKAWAKQPWFWVALGAVVAGFVVIGALSGHGKAAVKDPTSAIIDQAKAAPAVHPPTHAQAVAAAQAAAARQEAQRLVRQAQREANAPRLIEYYIKGTTNGATLTYTSTGDGTVQRDIGVLPEWRSGEGEAASRGLRADVGAEQSGVRRDHLQDRGAFAGRQCSPGGSGDDVLWCVRDRRLQRRRPLDAKKPRLPRRTPGKRRCRRRGEDAGLRRARGVRSSEAAGRPGRARERQDSRFNSGPCPTT